MNEIKYSITIKNETSKKKSVVANGNNNQTNKEPGTATDKKETDKAKDDGEMISALVAVKTIEPYIKQAANFAVSQISFQNGSTELQQRSQTFTNIAASAVSIGLVAIGNPVGAAKMAGMQMLQGAVSLFTNYVNIQNAKTMEQENLALRRSRAGMLAGRSRSTS